MVSVQVRERFRKVREYYIKKEQGYVGSLVPVNPHCQLSQNGGAHKHGQPIIHKWDGIR